MDLKNLISILTCILILGGCSSSYKKLVNLQKKEPISFQDHLLIEYEKRAIFEAEKMHDWNSAKLYSEKALKSLETDKIYPEKTAYWKLPKENIEEIRIGYDNLMTIYDDAKNTDPYNLAKAISSLDCWSEQQEEKWQTWDINNCKEDFLKSMQSMYKKISNIKKDKNIEKSKDNKFKETSKDQVTIVTKDKEDELMQIVYFDFDRFNLSEVSINKIKIFIEKNDNEINKYLVVGHTDTKGTKRYNLSLSIKRAEIVKNLLINYGVDKNSIKILGEGEENLAINTPDNTKHPANRRVEIKKTN